MLTIEYYLILLLLLSSLLLSSFTLSFYHHRHQYHHQQLRNKPKVGKYHGKILNCRKSYRKIDSHLTAPYLSRSNVISFRRVTVMSFHNKTSQPPYSDGMGRPTHFTILQEAIFSFPQFCGQQRAKLLLQVSHVQGTLCCRVRYGP